MSGRVVDIDVNPSDPTEFYVAYASGGVWYTINNGQSFKPIFDSTATLNIGDIVELESNIFTQVQKITANVPFDEAQFGGAVALCPYNCSIYIGAPNDGSASKHPLPAQAPKKPEFPPPRLIREDFLPGKQPR
jgi:hypothetical protein